MPAALILGRSYSGFVCVWLRHFVANEPAAAAPFNWALDSMRLFRAKVLPWIEYGFMIIPIILVLNLIAPPSQSEVEFEQASRSQWYGSMLMFGSVGIYLCANATDLDFVALDARGATKTQVNVIWQIVTVLVLYFTSAVCWFRFFSSILGIVPFQRLNKG
jgi:hypothetical protein